MSFGSGVPLVSRTPPGRAGATDPATVLALGGAWRAGRRVVGGGTIAPLLSPLSACPTDANVVSCPNTSFSFPAPGPQLKVVDFPPRALLRPPAARGTSARRCTQQSSSSGSSFCAPIAAVFWAVATPGPTGTRQRRCRERGSSE